MAQQTPIHCHPAAWDIMREQLPRLETNEGLLGGAMAIAKHGMPEAELSWVENELQGLVDQLGARLQSDDHRAVVAHAHDLFFGELGFRGDADFTNATNSFLPAVLARRQGLPITLSLVLKLVIEPFGPRVHGVNAPGRFLVRIEGEGAFTPMLVDAFESGKVLTVPEAVERVRTVVGDAVRYREPLPLATHREWLERMLRNLIGLYHEADRPDDRAAMEELARLLRS